ncbi:acyltransferase [Pantoea agglomerans]|uniref:acyltransferase family protein n=1 Tax=Enterobacter agglomerans TaxID=549 RepID=UPI00289D98EF|nr:acyltransferase [Pantoea agglomerans]WNK73187.1 acyltransferase [Pantoea agglomerans]
MRNKAIDSFRAISIILVTLFHLGRAFGAPGSNNDEFALGNSFGNGWVGVGMFFVISGFCMGASVQGKFSHGFQKRTYLRYVLNRFLRIAPAYYLSMIFWYFIITKYNVVVKPVAGFDLLTHIFFVHNFFNGTMYSVSGVYWTLAAEMQFYLLLPVLISLLSSLPGQAMALGATFVLALSIAALSNDVVLIFGLPAYLCLFISGVLSYFHRDNIYNALSRYGLIWIIVAFMVILIFSPYGVYQNRARLFEIIISCLFVIALAYASVRERYSNRKNIVYVVMAFIGRCSFSIYLYNYVMLALPVEYSGVVNFLILFTVTLAIGIFAHFIIEKPFEKLRKALMRTRTVAASGSI